ncbi:MAG: hypothetical protein AAF270_16010 [Pseudomonadota bacterium]
MMVLQWNVRVLSVAALALFVGSSAGAQSPDWMSQMTDVEPIELSERDVKRAIKTADQLAKAAEAGEIDESGMAPGNLDALIANRKAMSIIEGNDFTAESFTSTMMNIVMAMGAAEMEDNKEEVEQATAQLEAMKSQLSPEQYEMFASQILGVQKAFANAPAGNVELVRKYKDEIEALGE